MTSDQLPLRRQSRELALKMLFHIEFNKDSDVKASLARFVSTFAPDPQILSYSEELTLGTIENLEKIDSAIQGASAHWKTSRMDRIDLSILRVAVYEFLFNTSVPPKVVINEAIELGKIFGNSDSASFINGILDQVAKQNRLLENP